MDARWTIDVLAYNGTTEKEYGNEVPSWQTLPVQKRVYCWAPAGTNESTASRQTVTADLVVYVPPEFTLDPRDHVRILGQTYEVQGIVEDYNHGPFAHGPDAFTPGGTVSLRRFG